MRYKSQAFRSFKEYWLEVENQIGHKTKTLRSDRGGEYLNGEFSDCLKENGFLSQWTPLGTPQLNGVAERRNRTLLDMVSSMMSLTELSPSFWGYTLDVGMGDQKPIGLALCHSRIFIKYIRLMNTIRIRQVGSYAYR
ncbi:UNVERIFIED_CONTAM: hypothetical protein Sradi_6196900 [Sesamum radiatum]|uniref:Integrase catalytic domain-containing protein n=1 Tax=Sesamum radiatum TaxID=300843 RepID=A0AAW2K9Z6_SESRA